MDILIKADEILSATKYKSGKACLWVGGFQKAVEIPESIDYKTEADVLLKLWMDEIITDGEYNKIMERLNKAVVLERTT